MSDAGETHLLRIFYFSPIETLKGRFERIVYPTGSSIEHLKFLKRSPPYLLGVFDPKKREKVVDLLDRAVLAAEAMYRSLNGTEGAETEARESAFLAGHAMLGESDLVAITEVKYRSS